MVEFMSADHDATVIAAAEDIFELHELGEKLCRHRKTLSWYGHLRLLGFTVHPANSRCGLVYELPSSTHVQGSQLPHLHPIRSLREAISATHEHELTQPALEDKFRLAYNVLLSLLGYFANGDSHRHSHTKQHLAHWKQRATPISFSFVQQTRHSVALSFPVDPRFRISRST